ncbi:MAG: redox-regulated ATPase YchF [Desulfovibrionaceae bacterium]|nr:redox-regulated ATPase YchF [Desulfovibrionaceae bacterium]
MALSIGIVGLPNVGKSTLFNALTKAQNAQAANYPFCTIEPNKATVPVPDERLAVLEELVHPQKTVQATVDFIDIAGLVRGASQGEGLGNQFLGNIRDCSAILEVVRCFDDDNITHVDGSVNPARDVETIELELLIADSQTVSRRLERLKKIAKADKDARGAVSLLEKLLQHLMDGHSASSFSGKDDDAIAGIMKEMGLLTAKTKIFCANVNEDSLTSGNSYVQELREIAASQGAETVIVCARLEEELQGLSDADQKEILSSYDITRSSLENVIQAGYKALGLQSYFTVGDKENKAWTISIGWKAPQAAGVIHTDFEKGFIRAEVISYEDFIAHKTEAACRTAGVLRTEGKEYVVRDGDIMHFLFNV